MRPDERELDDEIRGHLAIEIQQRIDRGESPQTARARRAAAVRLRAAAARRDAPRLVQPLVRHGGGARAGYARRPAIAAAREGPRRHRRDHARARHRRQRRDLQRRPRRADAPARQSRRGAADLHRAERARPRRQRTRRSRFRRSRTSAGARRRSSAFGEFSTVDFTMVGLGEPRVVQAGVVDGHVLRGDGSASPCSDASSSRRTKDSRRPAWRC